MSLSLLNCLLKNNSWLSKYIAKAKIGFYEIWLIKGLGFKTVAYLNGGMISNHIK